MDRSAARGAYDRQKANARRRGIEWEFNFQSWLDWWGEDLERRGVGPNSLQMQRFADEGPYAAWNVRKGTPKDNAKTRGHMERKRNSLAAKAALEAARDADQGTAPERDELPEDEAYIKRMVGLRNSFQLTGVFKADK